MKASFFRTAVIAVLGMLFLVSAVFSEQSETVTIFFVKGNPQIMESGKMTWRACTEGATVDEGDRIRTKEGEAVELSFGEDRNNLIKIEENSDVIVRKISLPDRQLELVNGEVFSMMKKLPSRSTFEVRTPAGLSGARGTGWGTKTDGKSMTARSYEKNIYVKGIEKSGKPMKKELIVKAGWKTKFGKFEKPALLERLSRKEQKRWRAWKRDINKRLKAASKKGTKPFKRASRLMKDIDSRLDKLESFEETRDIKKIEKRIDKKSSSSGGGDNGYGEIGH